MMTDSAVAAFRATARERTKLRAAFSLLERPGRTTTITIGEDTVELSPSLIGVLAAAARALADGNTVALVTEEEEVSPAQAAKLLGVSRQYVDRLVSNGVLEARRLPGSSYRRIPVKAVLAHRETKNKKRAAIREIVDGALLAGLDY